MPVQGNKWHPWDTVVSSTHLDGRDMIFSVSKVLIQLSHLGCQGLRHQVSSSAFRSNFPDSRSHAESLPRVPSQNQVKAFFHVSWMGRH